MESSVKWDTTQRLTEVTRFALDSGVAVKAAELNQSIYFGITGYKDGDLFCAYEAIVAELVTGGLK